MFRSICMGRLGTFGVSRNQLADCETKLRWGKMQRNFVSVVRSKVWVRTPQDPKVSSEFKKKRQKYGSCGCEESEWFSHTESTSGLKYISSLPATAAYTAIVEKRRGTGGSDRLRENLTCQKISSLESINKYLKFCRLETWQTLMYVSTLSHYRI